MYRVLPIFVFSFLVSLTSAQNLEFTLAEPQPQLIDVYSGSSDSGDIDGDGDNDLIISGIDPGKRTALYLNDGQGNFAEDVDTPFPDASVSVTFFEDLDGDGDLDLFFSGNGFGLQEFAHVYLNDGQGEFTLLQNEDLPAFADTGVSLADLNGDGDVDIVLDVLTADQAFVAGVFLNDGNAGFTFVESAAFVPVQFARIECFDADGDMDNDVVISGDEENGSVSVRLYLNDGEGNFTEDESVDLIQLKADDIDGFDSDDDGDMDLLISGASIDSGVQTTLYLNDGEGVFSPLASSGIQNTFAGTNAVADLDNDGDDDLVILGSQDGGLPNIYNIVYANQGENVFVPVDTVGGEYIAACAVNDFNGDALPDLVIQGFVDDTNVYWNSTSPTGLKEEGVIPFEVYPNPFEDVFYVRPETESTQFSLQVVDIMGKVIFEQSYSSNGRLLVSVPEIPGGVYLLQLRSKGSISTKRIVKE